ncbi:hypothetical protein PtA15_4A774 [Puccinia triticina]|uniref:Uncharacterized protein n=1 Tax=Puccinia triticina TaxID=208348 RepID=A0ABY7CGG6_9BASI|nr:uncharacterized protein PtA15_4A774 [Puccinia triticina]WAQ84321.1 hypothetical protein PtA15_4A774 [Puccinia triticina]
MFHRTEPSFNVDMKNYIHLTRTLKTRSQDCSMQLHVNQYPDDLAKAFDRVPPQTVIGVCRSMWHFALSPILLESAWLIDHELNVEFLRLVLFHRYPKLAAAEPPISTPKTLEALAAPSREAGEKLLNPAQPELTDLQHI